MQRARSEEDVLLKVMSKLCVDFLIFMKGWGYYGAAVMDLGGVGGVECKSRTVCLIQQQHRGIDKRWRVPAVLMFYSSFPRVVEADPLLMRPHFLSTSKNRPPYLHITEMKEDKMDGACWMMRAPPSCSMHHILFLCVTPPDPALTRVHQSGCTFHFHAVFWDARAASHDI